MSRKKSMEPAIIVHGGAGHVADWQVPLLVDGGKKAAMAGYQVLSNHGSVLDAVEAAVKVMEDDTAFMAGLLNSPSRPPTPRSTVAESS